jgi:hypothetical protein
MAGASAATLLAAACLSNARADDGDRPTVWVELGGQLERVDGGQEKFAPSFVSGIDLSEFTSPLVVQRPPRYATGFEGNLSFQPEGSDWVFSAGVRYGRSNGSKKLHEDKPLETAKKYLSIPLLGYHSSYTKTAYARRYSDTAAKYDESHAVVDFMAGKDVGLGLFGRASTSVLSAGVRFAQFQAQSAVTIAGDHDFAFSYIYSTQLLGIPAYVKNPRQSWNLNRSRAQFERSFRGVGPSVGWQASAPMIGEPDRTELTLDWGINAALLFGRQKVKAHHDTHVYHHYQNAGDQMITTTPPSNVHNTARSRSVTVPNVGGFAGVSLKFPNAKISLGYRADFFFGAVDGGVDVRKTYDRDFYGPFATISIGFP